MFLLRDAELARAVAYRLVPDAPPRDQVAGPARLAAAFEQMLERAPDEADVRAVAAFLVHLSALFCLGEITLREPDAKSPLISTVLAAEAAGQRPRGLATLFALPGALALVDPRLADVRPASTGCRARAALAGPPRADRRAAQRRRDRRARAAPAPPPAQPGPRDPSEVVTLPTASANVGAAGSPRPR